MRVLGGVCIPDVAVIDWRQNNRMARRVRAFCHQGQLTSGGGLRPLRALLLEGRQRNRGTSDTKSRTDRTDTRPCVTIREEQWLRTAGQDQFFPKEYFPQARQTFPAVGGARFTRQAINIMGILQRSTQDARP